MKNNKLANIKKSADTTSKVLKAFSIVFLVGAIICLLSGISIFCFSEQLNEFVSYAGGQWKLAFGGTTQFIAYQGTPLVDSFNFETFSTWAGCNALYGAVVAGVFAFALAKLRKAFVTIKESESPFSETVLKQIKTAAIITTILVALSSVGIAVCVALSLWCLCSIFNYGIELQKNDDETL
ncbi:MAG: hypothetical protein K6A29_02340 [Lachnospiraceae bacterium]|nr:hypothetical protein [Lachnospiraceae bacterium]